MLDHSRTNLIWNHRTREELREALEAELRAFNIDKVFNDFLILFISESFSKKKKK